MNPLYSCNHPLSSRVFLPYAAAGAVYGTVDAFRFKVGGGDVLVRPDCPRDVAPGVRW